ncbi:MAG TPA: large conductance mechanosensitive channel protein MscL [Pirellulaceae bacterium]|nr:large conductance mechanosensitive channel protein MscL [Pirellulaceae bacterium]
MGFIKEFREFAMKGNVMDMAVGIIIGGAFGKIVSSMVNDIIMPVVGSLTAGSGSIGDQFLWLSDVAAKPNTIAAAKETGKAYIAWGPFAQATLDFVIVAFAIFMMIKAMNKARSFVEREEKRAPADPTTKKCEFCQSEISIQATRCPQCTSQLTTS